MGVDDAAEILSGCQPLLSNRQQVLVLAEEHAAKRCGSVQSGLSSSIAEPSSSAVRTSTPRFRNPAVMANGT
jgi:hypothetical protein